MPLPFLALPVLLKGAAVVAGTIGAATVIGGASDISEANKKMKEAEARNKKNIDEFRKVEDQTLAKMDAVGRLEVAVGKDFERFSNAYEQIRNCPKRSAKDLGEGISKFNFEEIKITSVGAGALLGASVGSAGGAAFGVAAASGVNTAVLALGTASTGTAISTLSGAAATKAALAAIGGGSLAAGGGGMAAGAAILSGVTMGAGALVFGATLAFTGSKLLGKADEAQEAVLESEVQLNEAKGYLNRAYTVAEDLQRAITNAHKLYDINVRRFIELVSRKKDWNDYSFNEKLLVENNMLIVAILNKMISTPILKNNTHNPDARKPINTVQVYEVIKSSESALFELSKHN